GDHDASDAERRVELLRLRERVLALIGVEHQQHLMWGRGHYALDDALDLLELIHQMGLAVQASGGVGKHYIHATRLRRLQCIEDHRAGVGAGALRTEERATALRPDGELLDCRGPKGIAGREYHAEVLGLLQPVRELANAGGLARAVHTDREHHERL